MASQVPQIYILLGQPIAAQNNEKKSSQLHGFACSSCNSSPAVFSKAFLVLFSSSSLLRHQRRLSSSAMTCFAKILSLCEKYQVVAISKGPLTVCWEERLRHAPWTCSMSTCLLVCSLAPALESHYCCGARRRSGGIPDCSYHIDLLCSSGCRIIREVKSREGGVLLNGQYFAVGADATLRRRW